MRFFTSDTHFGHKNIIKFCGRPFNDVDHMNEILIKNWNAAVEPDDEVFHLGDVALGPWDKWHNILTRLNGFKTLVVGNHDRIFKGEKPRMQERFAEHYARWFDVVTDEVTNIPVGGRLVNLSHFPYSGDSHAEERYREFRLKDEGVPLIHGHVHENNVVTRTKWGTLQIHVGVDAWDYGPVSEDEISLILDAHL
jgi:calcineurin-like phosphoesterase family protein